MVPISLGISLLLVYAYIYMIKLIKKVNFLFLINKFKILFDNFLQGNRSGLSAKLQELNALKEQGLITEEDYNNKKAKLLDEF